MKLISPFLAAALSVCILVSCAGGGSAGSCDATIAKSYSQLPLGSVKAEGWLLETLQRQRDGLTSRLDEVFGDVVGPRNGWLGGDADQWERGPYWMDGLLPLAYILDDQALKDKVQPWIEWTLASQDSSGFFGPAVGLPNDIPGLQRSNARDWWPRMVMLKVLRQHYEATGDERVIPFLMKYFRYQLETLPSQPLGTWTSWAEYRACDNMSVALWTYEKTGEKWLLDLVELLHQQGFDYVGLMNDGGLGRFGSIHCVNLAQGFKEPVVYWSMKRDSTCLKAVAKGFEDLRKFDAYPNGMYGGDECLHGNNPNQGSELCSAVELMFSLEEMLRITGDNFYADYLERVAYNALPTQITDDFMAKQYYQQVNQVMIKSGDGHNFDQKQEGTALDFGIQSGYTCCLANFHQGWPKFVQNLWLRSMDGGLAALCYGPSSAQTEIDGHTVCVNEKTYYPFDGKVAITVCVSDAAPESEGVPAVAFPLYLRIPAWAEGACVSVNGDVAQACEAGQTLKLDRSWKDGDKVCLDFPMHIKTERWYEKSVSVERGPLLYALKIGEKWVKHQYDPQQRHGDFCWEVYPTTPWNYALLKFDEKAPDSAFEVTLDEEKLQRSNWYWNLENCPVSMTAKAVRVPWWTLYGNEAGPLPYVVKRHYRGLDMPEETVTLVPYGCTTLRIAEFPMAR